MNHDFTKIVGSYSEIINENGLFYLIDVKLFEEIDIDFIVFTGGGKALFRSEREIAEFEIRSISIVPKIQIK